MGIRLIYICLLLLNLNCLNVFYLLLEKLWMRLNMKTVKLFGIELTEQQFEGFNLLYCDSGALAYTPSYSSFSIDNPHFEQMKKWGIYPSLLMKFVELGYFDFADIFGNLIATDKLRHARNEYMRAYRIIYPDNWAKELV